MTLTTSRTTTQDPTTNSGHQQSMITADYHIRIRSYYRPIEELQTEHAARPAANEYDRSPTYTSLIPRVKASGRRTGN